MVESLLFVFMILAFLSYYENTNKDKTEIKEELTLYELQYEKGETIYLAIGEEIDFENEVVIVDPNIIKKENNKLIALDKGKTTIRDLDNYIDYQVSISNLYEIEQIREKEYLPCDLYSKEDNDYLDMILKEKINKAGYKSRAGVVEAARFLTLQFPYKLNYSYENGRIEIKNHLNVDGEGRYYHYGLFLDESRFEDLKYSLYGPVCWGCRMYSIETATYLDNGLDCSGFLTWALYNGGYDPGELGAGINEDDDDDLTDLGERIYLDDINTKDIKAGDFIGHDGHIGIIIGIDQDNYYVAESFWDDDLNVKAYKFDELKKDEWEYIVLMDKYYKNDGNYTAMW